MFKAVNPASEWGWKESYLASIADSTRMLIYMLSKDAGKKSKIPESVVPDFIRREASKSKTRNNIKATGQMVADIDSIKQLLAKERK